MIPLPATALKSQYHKIRLEVLGPCLVRFARTNQPAIAEHGGDSFMGLTACSEFVESGPCCSHFILTFEFDAIEKLDFS